MVDRIVELRVRNSEGLEGIVVCAILSPLSIAAKNVFIIGSLLVASTRLFVELILDDTSSLVVITPVERVETAAVDTVEL